MKLRRAFLNIIAVLVTLVALVVGSRAQTVFKVWVADNGDGTYKNPIIHADFSRPGRRPRRRRLLHDGVELQRRAGSARPPLGERPRQLVGRRLRTRRQPPFEVFDKPQHGNGVWAPAIRYHAGEFYISTPDPTAASISSKRRTRPGRGRSPSSSKRRRAGLTRARCGTKTAARIL